MISEKYRDVETKVNEAERVLEDLEAIIKRKKAKLKKELEDVFDKTMTSKLNKEHIQAFSDEPYIIVPKKQDEWYVAVPKLVDFNLGWLERSTNSYNLFVVNKYMQWMGNIPEKLREKFQFKEPMPLKVFDGMLLTGKQHQDAAYRRYSNHLLRKEGSDRIRIKKGLEFKLIASMIDDGILPFMPKPIEKKDMRKINIDLKLRDYQEDAWNKFKETGAVGVYHPFGSGKTIIGIWILGHVKVEDLPNLVVVPTKTLKEQWIIRIDQYLQDVKYEIEVETYHAYQKLRNRDFGVVVFDECHRLPANTFSRLATIRAKYRVGLSATPYREDGRTDYIFALTGFPIGLDWTRLLDMKIVTKPSIYLYILPDRQAKIRKLEELLRIPKKTLVFCDSIDLGKRLSSKFEVPFIHGETSKRMEILEQSNVSIISRVGDEGISLPDLERVIEIDFLFGSRRQEGQRMGRTFHSQKKAEHIILMTDEEFENYEKRLYAIYEKGFRINIVRG